MSLAPRPYPDPNPNPDVDPAPDDDSDPDLDPLTDIPRSNTQDQSFVVNLARPYSARLPVLPCLSG